MWRWVWCGAGKQFIIQNEQKSIDRIGQDYLGNCIFLQKLYSIKHRQKLQKCQHIDKTTTSAITDLIAVKPRPHAILSNFFQGYRSNISNITHQRRAIALEQPASPWLR